jgi:DNA-binding transcriptional MocR family regulator
MEIWSDSEMQQPTNLPSELTAGDKLRVLQHAYSERYREITYLKQREDKMVIWLASFFALSILGSLVFSSNDINWVAKIFFSGILAVTGWYGSEYIAQGRDDMQTIVALMRDIREEISLVSFGYSRELLPDPNRWEVASRWEMGPIDMFLKGTALVAIITLLFA